MLLAGGFHSRKNDLWPIWTWPFNTISCQVLDQMQEQQSVRNANEAAGGSSDLVAGGFEMSSAEFRGLRKLIKDHCGINLTEGKETLVKARLGRRLRELRLQTFSQYLKLLSTPQGVSEFPALLDAISTNVTSFFRQPEHFRYIRKEILPPLVARSEGGSKRLRIWSAGCSSGMEPYSVGIHLWEGIPSLGSWDAKILATDIADSVLERAARAQYSDKDIGEIPPKIKSRYFRSARSSAGGSCNEVIPKVRELMTFRKLNLMRDWPMSGPFEVILCRNVMIYFDRPTQEQLVQRYRDLLTPTGTLFIGHSESLTGLNHGLKMVGPATYVRK